MSEQEFQAKSLDTIISKSEPEVVTEPAKAEPAKEPEKGAEPGATPALDKDGKPIEKAAEKPEPAKTDDPIKAMRKALNATQRELAAFRQKSAEAAKPETVIDPLVDPEGFRKSVDDSVETRIVRERFNDAMERGSEDHGEAEWTEALEFFEEEARKNPALAQEMLNQRKPDKFVWNYVQQAKARQEIGDPVAFAEKIRTETTAAFMAKMDELVDQKVKTILAGKLPSSLADEQTQGGRAAAATSEWAGPKPIGEILKTRK